MKIIQAAILTLFVLASLVNQAQVNSDELLSNFKSGKLHSYESKYNAELQTTRLEYFGKMKIKLFIEEKKEDSETTYDIDIYSNPPLYESTMNYGYLLEDGNVFIRDNDPYDGRGEGMVILFEDKILFGAFLNKKLECGSSYSPASANFKHFRISKVLSKNELADDETEEKLEADVQVYLKDYLKPLIERQNINEQDCEEDERKKQAREEIEKHPLFTSCSIFWQKDFIPYDFRRYKLTEEIRTDYCALMIPEFELRAPALNLDNDYSEKEYQRKNPNKFFKAEQALLWQKIANDVGILDENLFSREEVYSFYQDREMFKREREALSKMHLSIQFRLDLSGGDGKNGADGKTGTPYFDGIGPEIMGGYGENGEMGAPGCLTEIYVDVVSEDGKKWLKTSVKYYRFNREKLGFNQEATKEIHRMFDLSSGSRAKLSIKANGGNGGKGGDGGVGGLVNIGMNPDGKPGQCGNGGIGGYGGDGGDITVYYTANAKQYLKKILDLKAKGGDAGSPGYGGRFAESKFDHLKGENGGQKSDGSDKEAKYVLWNNPSFNW